MCEFAYIKCWQVVVCSFALGLEQESLAEPVADPTPLKWSDLRYVFDIQEDCNGKEAIQA
jgi:hypothetical protein